MALDFWSAAQDPGAAERARQATVHHVAQAVAGLEQAAEDARAVDVDYLPPEHAARLADQLTAALGDVTTLQRRLHRRSRQAAVRQGSAAGQNRLGGRVLGKRGIGGQITGAPEIFEHRTTHGIVDQQSRQ